MDTRRQLKYAKLIQKELSEIFLHDKKSLFGNAFVTITSTEVSPDLAVAKIYMSFMLVEDKKAMIEMMQENAKVFRQALGAKIRNVARIVPEIVFYLDDSAEYAIKMDKLITSLNIPKEEN
ncbi:MAG: 30S ribosome-binding factor RbfA [Cytophagales bacterium]